MGLTYQEAELLGIAHEHPDHPSRKGLAPPPSAVEVRTGPTTEPGRRPRIAKVNDKGQNKTEAAYDARLAELAGAGVVRAYLFERFTLRLAAKTRLTPDFLVTFERPDPDTLTHLPAFVDVKGGPVEDDAAVKMKVAAEMFAHLFTFWIVRREKGRGWEYRRVTERGGIGQVSVFHPFVYYPRNP